MYATLKKIGALVQTSHCRNRTVFKCIKIEVWSHNRLKAAMKTAVSHNIRKKRKINTYAFNVWYHPKDASISTLATAINLTSFTKAEFKLVNQNLNKNVLQSGLLYTDNGRFICFWIDLSSGAQIGVSYTLHKTCQTFLRLLFFKICSHYTSDLLCLWWRSILLSAL